VVGGLLGGGELASVGAAGEAGGEGAEVLVQVQGADVGGGHLGVEHGPHVHRTCSCGLYCRPEMLQSDFNAIGVLEEGKITIKPFVLNKILIIFAYKLAVHPFGGPFDDADLARCVGLLPVHTSPPHTHTQH